ncbi:MAG: hypothetical protein DRR42_27380 [Gammaproteobacteria bacterium]|nr:MAG: hypothetical protein DRR42_27380 [Gammaproteobacteria bacterium]
MNFKKLLNSVGMLFALLAIIWFGDQLLEHLAKFPTASVSALVFVCLAILFYSVPAIVSGVAWCYLLQATGERQLQMWRVVSIACLSQIGKYAPGNVAHHVGRVVLAKRYGLGMTNTLFTMFMETVWVIVIAGLLALVAIVSVGGRVFAEVPHLPQWWVLGGLVVIAMLAPVLGHRLFERGALWWASRKGITIQSVQMPPLSTFWLVGLLYIINYLILGLILQLIATQVFDVIAGDFLLFSGIFAVAWIVGFITPGAPAGLGVREVVLVAALTPICGNENAIGIAAVLRVVTVLGDGLVFLIGLGLAKSIKNNPPGSSENLS